MFHNPDVLKKYGPKFYIGDVIEKESITESTNVLLLNNYLKIFIRKILMYYLENLYLMEIHHGIMTGIGKIHL